MIVDKRFDVALAKDCPPGTLVRVLDNGSSNLGLILKHDPDQDVALVGLFERGPTRELTPGRVAIDGHETVMSYGSDWILELEETGAEVPGNSATLAFTNGAITQTPSYSYLYFARPRNEPNGRGFTIDLSDLTISSPTAIRNGVTVLNWSIWLSRDDKFRPNANPYFRFRASPQ